MSGHTNPRRGPRCQHTNATGLEDRPGNCISTFSTALFRHPFQFVEPRSLLATFLVCAAAVTSVNGQEVPDYSTIIAPILTKYCTGCHNSDDHEGELSLESYAQLQRGGSRGPALLPGNSSASRMVRMLHGRAEPAMPPEDSEAPTADEIALLAAWIDAGAKGPDGAEPDQTILLTPELKTPRDFTRSITALATSPDDSLVAIARFTEVQLASSEELIRLRTLAEHPGKINAVHFSPDGSQLIVASGIAGLYGQVRIWDVQSGNLVRKFRGHRDAIYDARISPDGAMLATASYDQKIILWNSTGEQLRTLEGHNGAIYGLAFSPDGRVLASASGDATVKIWRTSDGQRLDTLSQPLKEQYCVTVSPDGRYVVAGGADNRIRVWRLISRSTPAINPLVYSRFAHEGPIIQLAISPDGTTLVTSSEDRTLKVWEAESFTQTFAYDKQPDIVSSLTISSDGQSFIAGRMDGSLERYAFPASDPDQDQQQTEVVSQREPMTPDLETHRTAETEPNHSTENATPVSLPVVVTGTIEPSDPNGSRDADLYRFHALAGQTWILEINAARHESPLDSKVEVLDELGQPVLRVLMQAVRDTYLTFNGRDADQSESFRLHNWEEMDVNQYLYMRGEVVKLFLWPRGPDSGFNLYAGQEKRHCFFETTATTHALHEPCYIVEPHPPGSRFIPNGLPVFPIFFENDDDALRKIRTDSYLTFTAPEDGDYFARVTDARGFGGPEYQYELTVRPPQADFQVTLEGRDLEINAGSGKRFEVIANRIDGFDGPIRIDIEGLPPGFNVTTPIFIQAGHLRADGVVTTAPDAPQPTDVNAKSTRVTATAILDGNEVTKEIDNLGEIKLADSPKFVVSISPTDPDQSARTLVLAPGGTITATLRIERNGFDGAVTFDPRNLPHGVIVDNIGLNSVVILEKQIQRTLFLKAANWVPETTRLMFFEAHEEGKQASGPIVLHVRK